MKTICVLMLIFLFDSLFGQEPEQIAINFYAKEFKEENKGNRIRYDGIITKLENKYAKNSVIDFYDCKWNEEHYKKIDGNAFENWEKVYDDLKTNNLLYQDFQGNLIVPKELVYRKKLKDSSIYRNFPDYYLNKAWYWIFPEKYNVTVYPSVKYKDFLFVEIHIDKKDGEFGRMFYVQLDENLKILESCESGWIQ